MEIPDEIKIKTMQLAQKGVGIENADKPGLGNDSWGQFSKCGNRPEWNWVNHVYRPIAPKRHKHIGELREPEKGEMFLEWDYTVVEKDHFVETGRTVWIVCKVYDGEPLESLDLIGWGNECL